MNTYLEILNLSSLPVAQARLSCSDPSMNDREVLDAPLDPNRGHLIADAETGEFTLTLGVEGGELQSVPFRIEPGSSTCAAIRNDPDSGPYVEVMDAAEYRADGSGGQVATGRSSWSKVPVQTQQKP